ncbi:MAG: glycine zipper domain-containing protein [Nitrospirota bacterium]
MRKLVILVIIGFQLSGCATLRNEFDTRANMGMFGGCVSGVVVGGVAGNVFGALLGGMIGTATGNFIGEHYDKKLGTREEAMLKHRMKDREEKLLVEASQMHPRTATAGSVINTSVRYTVVAPSDVREIKITETRMFFSDNEGFIKLDEREVLRTQGTFSSAFKFTVPEKISKGDALVITVISSDKQKDSVTSSLKIS